MGGYQKETEGPDQATEEHLSSNLIQPLRPEDGRAANPNRLSLYPRPSEVVEGVLDDVLETLNRLGLDQHEAALYVSCYVTGRALSGCR